MSERGSFVTEYIYCPKCFEAAKKILLDRVKYLCSQTIDSWAPGDVCLPIIAGKVGGGYSNEEFVTFETEYVPDLEAVLCHPLRIAVLADTVGERIYTVEPAEPTR